MSNNAHYEQQCSECKFCIRSLESGYPVNAKHAELERRSAHQLRLKAAEMLRPSTQLVKSHGDHLCLEYLWNGDEYGSLENSVKQWRKRRIWRTTRNLSNSEC